MAEGEFWAAENDSNSFIKQQLKTNALKNALNMFFSQMELNSSVFWQIIDKKIDTDLKDLKTSSELKISKARDAGAFDQVLKLESNWRAYKLNYIEKFLESQRLYIGFSSSTITSSMVNPQLKLATFKVTLNRNMVRKFYFEMTKSNSTRQFQNLLISFKIFLPSDENKGLIEFNEIMSLVKKAVMEKWLTWLEAEYKDNFNNFILTTDEQESQLNNYIFSPPGTINQVNLGIIGKIKQAISSDRNEVLGPSEMSEESNSEKNNEAPMTESPERMVSFHSSENEFNFLKDSQWLQINLIISDIEYDDNFKKMKLSLSGGHLFFDLNSREVVLSEDYPETEKTYSFEDHTSFSSSIGTNIFNLPLDGLREGKKVFVKAPQINNQAILTIRNLKKPEDIISLSDFLNLGGESVNLKVNSFEIVDSGAKITLNYFGELEHLKKKFYEWENKKVIPIGRWHFYANDGELNAELLPDLKNGQGNSANQEEKL